MGNLLQDVRFGLRSFAKSPGFTAVAILTLALGIGATTSIFTVTDAVILRPLPYEEPDRLVRVFVTDLNRGVSQTSHDGAGYLDLRNRSESFDGIAAYRGLSINLVGGELPVRKRGASVVPEFFSVLGVDALVGRTFSPALDAPESDRAVVLGHSLWETQFGGDDEILGQSLKLNDELYTVVGIMPPGFDFPAGSELYISPHYRVPDPPFDLGEDPAENRGAQFLSVVGRLRDGVQLEQAQAELDIVAAQVAEAYPSSSGAEGLVAVPLHDTLVSEARPLLYVLLGAVGFVLLIACANVASLLIVRATRKEKELAIRRALGAGAGRIVRQLLTESILLALIAGVFGIVLALWGTDLLLLLAPAEIPRAEEVGVDLRVLGFTFLIVVGTGVLFGMAPVPQVSRDNLQSTIKDGAARITGSSGNRLRKALIVGEVAISFLLVVGAGLMGRTFFSLVAVDPGFDSSNTLAVHMALPENKYSEDHEFLAFYHGVLDRVETMPGVESAAMVLTLPMDANIRGTLSITIDGQPRVPGEDLVAGFQVVSPDYFRTLRIPLLSGRLLTAADSEDAPPVLLINQAFVDRHFPDEDPLGKRVTWGDGEGPDSTWSTVVGVVGNTLMAGLDDQAEPMTYQTYPQSWLPFLTLVVRSQGDAASLIGSVRAAILEVDPEQPIYGETTLDEALAGTLGNRRFNMLLLGVFSFAALVMAAVGLYGVLSFSVEQRSREIGVRRALGAEQSAVVLQVVREGATLVLIGLLIGAAGAFALSGVVSSQIHGVSAADPISYAVAILVLGTIAILACAIPALRASRVDPLIALKSE
jgi:putative ABC transport system permease protein